MAAPGFGKDRIYDWQDGFDKVSLAGTGLAFSSFTLALVGADTVLAQTGPQGNSITLLNVNMALIEASDFIV